MNKFSPVFKGAFFLIIGGMIFIAVLAQINRPPGPLSEADIEQTVAAGVNMALTETAVIATPTALPDVEATVAARLQTSPVPTDDPNLIPVSDLERQGGIISVIGGIINGVFSLLGSLWNLFSFGGVALQLCCCLLIPIGALIALARESM